MTDSSCFICGSKISCPICVGCKRDSMKLERCRQMLAARNLTDDLRKLYLKTVPNKNTSFFWNKKMLFENHFADQDEITKRRIITAISFLPENSKKVLDLGVGYGFLEEMLLKGKIIYEIFGNDISDIAIKNLKKRFKGNFRKEDVLEMKYPNEYFDAVFALELIEHISPDKVLMFYEKVYQLLSPSGVFILSVPLNEVIYSFEDNPSGHVRQYTDKLIKGELSIAGLKVVDFKELYAFENFYMIKDFLRKFILVSRWKPNDIVILARKF